MVEVVIGEMAGSAAASGEVVPGAVGTGEAALFVEAAALAGAAAPADRAGADAEARPTEPAAPTAAVAAVEPAAQLAAASAADPDVVSPAWGMVEAAIMAAPNGDVAAVASGRCVASDIDERGVW